MAFDQIGPDPPSHLALGILNCFDPFFFILIVSIHFKTDFSMTKKNLHFLHSPKLYYTYYLLRLFMMVCTVLIWFILTVLQESSNLDAIFIVCRKIKHKISKLVFSPTPQPLFDQKPTFFFFSFNHYYFIYVD